MQVPPEEFILRLPQFLNNICTKNCIPNEGKNAVVIPVFKVINLLNAKLNPSCKSQLAEFF